MDGGNKNGSSLLGFFADKFRASEAQLFQDLWVLWELGGITEGFFVEFGAFDGRVLSNTFLMEKSYAWTGVLAEPNPERHESIRATRSAVLDHRCVYIRSGDTVNLIVTPEAEFATIDVYEHEAANASKRRDSLVVPVETVSLHDLFDEHSVPTVVDYLSVDTEGSELDILSSYKWNRHIRCITVEHNFTDNQRMLDDLLFAKGYVRRFADLSKWDGWYIHSNDLANHV